MSAPTRRIGEPATEREVANANHYCAQFGLNVVRHSGSHVTIRRGSKVVANWWPTTQRTDIRSQERPKTLQRLCEIVAQDYRTPSHVVTGSGRQPPLHLPLPTAAASAAPPSSFGERTHAPPVASQETVRYFDPGTPIDPRVMKVFCSLLENPEVVRAYGGKPVCDDDDSLFDIDSDTDMESLVERSQQIVSMLAAACPHDPNA